MSFTENDAEEEGEGVEGVDHGEEDLGYRVPGARQAPANTGASSSTVIGHSHEIKSVRKRKFLRC